MSVRTPPNEGQAHEPVDLDALTQRAEAKIRKLRGDNPGATTAEILKLAFPK
ncbi:hypothetical protein [Sphingosinicella humi]|uniref:hypothetical protein n=1 Tax=Allosphingosinicella humi TaxID=2068657 RepID=UPI001304F42B|nr:hypothetical protein [Sphingosinicella humi]